MGLQDFYRILKTAFWQWYEEKTFLLGAALAFYTAFSIAPVALIAVSVAGLVFSRETAWERMSEEVNRVAGPRIAQAIREIAQQTQESGAGLVGTAVSLAMLLVGATTVFAQLQAALNAIWGVRPKRGRGVMGMLRDRVLSFSVVLGIGFLLLVSLVASAALSSLEQLMTPAEMPGGVLLWQAINWFLSFALVTLLFAMIFKVLPDVEVAWEDVWVGAALTALLFAVGKYLLGMYLGQSAIVSAYGAAGSFVVLLLWVYYSSQLLLFGAEFTQTYARRSGKPLVPAANAERIE
jgi:membrane protein